MRKQEFIEELKYSLEGKLSEQDIVEVTADYSDVFENATEEGKSEATVAEELGSPAKIARTILEEDELKKKEAAARDAEERARLAEEEARNARAAEAHARAAEAQARAAASAKPAIDPKYAPFVGRFAPMGSRLAAVVIDGLMLVVLFFLMLFLSVGLPSIIASMMGRVGYEYMKDSAAISILLLLFVVIVFGAFNILTSLFIWATNGYTPGKWLLKIRVVKLNGEKITFMEAFLREFLIKSIASGMTSGLLDIFSFIWGCASDTNKTVHDLVADTTVISVTRER